jgi:hypothetical protein
MAILAPHLAAAELHHKVGIGLSSEFLAFTLGNEVDVKCKAERIREVMGPDVLIFIVCRSQCTLLPSLYVELLKGGYCGTFEEFLWYTYLFRDRNWCFDLCFDKIVSLYSQIFGASNVHAIAFESLVSEPEATVRRLCGILGISNNGIRLRRINSRASATGVYEHLRQLNQKMPHEFGGAFFKPFNCSRLHSYFASECDLAVPAERVADDYLRIPLFDAAKALQGINPTSLSLEWPDKVWSRLRAIYAPSNARFADMTGIECVSYGYPMM